MTDTTTRITPLDNVVPTPSRAEIATAQKRRIKPWTDEQCTLKCRKESHQRRSGSDMECTLDCTLNFHHYYPHLCQRIPALKPKSDRYWRKPLEGRFVLKAQLPARRVPDYFAVLRRSPVEIIEALTKMTADYEDAKPTIYDIVTAGPDKLDQLFPSEVIYFVHRAHRFQRACLWAEGQVQRVFAPIAKRIANIPERWENGSIKQEFIRNTTRFYDLIAGGEVLQVAARSCVQGAALMGKAAAEAARTVRQASGLVEERVKEQQNNSKKP